MSKKAPVITGPDGKGGWKSSQDGKNFGYKDTKKEAMEIGQDQAQKDGVEHRIQKKDGKIGESNSYGNDPNPPKDKDGKKSK